VVECGEDHATVRAVVRLLRAKMTMAFLALFPGHPWRQVVEIKVGRSWGELVSFKTWLVR
jgi:hypothetical protein